MGDLVPGSGPNYPAIRNFCNLEPVLSALAKTREAVAIAQEPSRELLDEIEAALTLVGQHRDDLDVAARPASLGMVGVYLSALMLSRPSGGAGDAAFFGRVLRDDVFSLQPTEGAMEMACRRWRQRSNFIPTIAEMMPEVKSARDELAGAIEFAGRLSAIHDAMAAELNGRTS